MMVYLHDYLAIQSMCMQAMKFTNGTVERYSYEHTYLTDWFYDEILIL